MLTSTLQDTSMPTPPPPPPSLETEIKEIERYLCIADPRTLESKHLTHCFDQLCRSSTEDLDTETIALSNVLKVLSAIHPTPPMLGLLSRIQCEMIVEIILQNRVLKDATRYIARLYELIKANPDETIPSMKVGRLWEFYFHMFQSPDQAPMEVLLQLHKFGSIGLVPPLSSPLVARIQSLSIAIDETLRISVRTYLSLIDHIHKENTRPHLPFRSEQSTFLGEHENEQPEKPIDLYTTLTEMSSTKVPAILTTVPMLTSSLSRSCLSISSTKSDIVALATHLFNDDVNVAVFRWMSPNPPVNERFGVVKRRTKDPPTITKRFHLGDSLTSAAITFVGDTAQFIHGNVTRILNVPPLKSGDLIYLFIDSLTGKTVHFGVNNTALQVHLSDVPGNICAGFSSQSRTAEIQLVQVFETTKYLFPTGPSEAVSFKDL